MSVLEISAEDYHADEIGHNRPSLSSSIAYMLCSSSPAHARAAHPKLNPDLEREQKTIFDIGNAAHGILLEGVDRIVEVDAPDWRSKTAREERVAAYAHGYTPLLIHQADRVRQMVAAIHAQIAAVDVDPPLLVAGKPERTIVWEERGVLCRALVDWLHDDVATVDDVKTTSGSAAPERWSRGPFFDKGFDVQSAFHSRGVRALGAGKVQFRYIVVETAPPFALQVFEPGPDVLAVADAKIDFALRVWQRCLAENRWPAYPAHVATIELPPWEEPRWMEREAREAA